MGGTRGKAVAITALSPAFPQSEANEAKEFCRRYGIRQILVTYDILSMEKFRQNPVDRCYYCKKSLFTLMRSVAAENGFSVIAEGSNVDDLGDGLCLVTVIYLYVLAFHAVEKRNRFFSSIMETGGDHHPDSMWFYFGLFTLCVNQITRFCLYRDKEDSCFCDHGN